MLVVTRKRSESIMIGDDIEVIITKISGKRVRVGIIADRDKYQIHRKERSDDMDNTSVQFHDTRDVPMRHGDDV